LDNKYQFITFCPLLYLGNSQQSNSYDSNNTKVISNKRFRSGSNVQSKNGVLVVTI